MTLSPFSGRGSAATLWRRCAVGLLGLVCLMTSAGSWAADDPPGRVGRVALLEGQVWLREPGATEWTELHRNRPLTTGDRLSTERGARVEVQIGSSTLRMDEDSDLEVYRLDDERVDLMLHDGKAAVRVREPEVAAEFSLRTADGSFLPRGPGFLRLDRDPRSTLAAVFQGEWQFDGRDSSLSLAAGQRAEFWVDPGDRATHYSWAKPSNDDFDRWVRLEDSRETQRLAQQQQRYLSPEMTGANDLNQYGRWEQHPEYGAIWSPLQVQADWAPYRYGHWAYVRPWGWTWVDDAAWGFAPFHYGRWVNWRGRWCWTPGQYVRRPVYAPAMVAWVGQGGVSVSVSLGQRPGGMVGWVPLAPREIYYPSYTTSVTYVQNVNVYRGRVPERVAPSPGQPVMYTNRGVPGGVTMVSADVLAQRQPVNRNLRPIEPQGAEGERRGDRGERGAVLTTIAAPPAMGPLGGTGRVVREGGERPGQAPGSDRGYPSAQQPQAVGQPAGAVRAVGREGRDGSLELPSASGPTRGRAEPVTPQAAPVMPAQPGANTERRWSSQRRAEGQDNSAEADDRWSRRPSTVQRTVLPSAEAQMPQAQMPQAQRPQAPVQQQPQAGPSAPTQRVERPAAQEREERQERRGNARVERGRNGDLKRDPNQVN
jgi:hypothetical protein